MFKQFEENITDGRLTVPSDGRTYRLREAILLSKRLGRPLSQDEMKKLKCEVISQIPPAFKKRGGIVCKER